MEKDQKNLVIKFVYISAKDISIVFNLASGSFDTRNLVTQDIQKRLCFSGEWKKVTSSGGKSITNNRTMRPVHIYFLLSYCFIVQFVTITITSAQEDGTSYAIFWFINKNMNCTLTYELDLLYPILVAEKDKESAAKF